MKLIPLARLMLNTSCLRKAKLLSIWFAYRVSLHHTLADFPRVMHLEAGHRCVEELAVLRHSALKPLQVAVERTKPTGRVIGIDIIPAQPPKGVSTIQGNFLSKEVQEEVKRFLSDPDRGRPRDQLLYFTLEKHRKDELKGLHEHESYIDMERYAEVDGISSESVDSASTAPRVGRKGVDDLGKMVDVVLSDMSAPWEQTTGFWKKSLSGPYNRMMNTSGINFKDHAGSMVRYITDQFQSQYSRMTSDLHHRICARLPFNFLTTLSKWGDTSSASSTRVQRTSNWKHILESYLVLYIGRSLNRLEV